MLPTVMRLQPRALNRASKLPIRPSRMVPERRRRLATL